MHSSRAWIAFMISVAGSLFPHANHNSSISQVEIVHWNRSSLVSKRWTRPKKKNPSQTRGKKTLIPTSTNTSTIFKHSTASTPCGTSSKQHQWKHSGKSITTYTKCSRVGIFILWNNSQLLSKHPLLFTQPSFLTELYKCTYTENTSTKHDFWIQWPESERYDCCTEREKQRNKTVKTSHLFGWWFFVLICEFGLETVFTRLTAVYAVNASLHVQLCVRKHHTLAVTKTLRSFFLSHCQ